jgi:hypothetical protein
MTKQRDVALGVQLEMPALWIPWDVSVRDFLKLFTDNKQSVPRLVASGYYVARCHILHGLNTQVGFHFEPANDGGRFNELELFDNGENDIEKSYRVFHERLVYLFGEPTKRTGGTFSVSMPTCEWRLGSVNILHYVTDRFGPEEHVRIRKRQLTFGAGSRMVTALVIALLALLYLWSSRGWHP